MKGYINSFQSLGAVDGPGVRFTVFVQGCSLRCCFCHNPDTWKFSGGKEYEASEIFDKVKRFKPYFIGGGGLTVSGGEALRQPQFVEELFMFCKHDGINTALDTSGDGDLSLAQKILKWTDLVMCDVKFTTEELYKSHTGGSLIHTQNFMRLCETMRVPMWVRHVVIPGLTDTEDEIKKIIEISTEFSNLTKIELLPFRKLCQTKYDDMKITFPLEKTEECDQSTIEQLKLLIPENLR